MFFLMEVFRLGNQYSDSQVYALINYGAIKTELKIRNYAKYSLLCGMPHVSNFCLIYVVLFLGIVQLQRFFFHYFLFLCLNLKKTKAREGDR